MKINKSLDTKEIGQRVKKLRLDRGLRQDQLGQVLGGLSRPQISNLELGKRNFNIHQLKILADYFGCSLATLGVETEEVETVELLERAKLIFENDKVPATEKQELFDSLMNLYVKTKSLNKDV